MTFHFLLRSLQLLYLPGWSRFTTGCLSRHQLRLFQKLTVQWTMDHRCPNPVYPRKQSDSLPFQVNGLLPRTISRSFCIVSQGCDLIKDSSAAAVRSAEWLMFHGHPMEVRMFVARMLVPNISHCNLDVAGLQMRSFDESFQ